MLTQRLCANGPTFGVGSNVETDITVFDAVLSGVFPTFDWAAGIQLRSENYDSKPFAPNDLSLNPCRTDAENERFRASGANAQGTDNCAGRWYFW